MTERDGIAGKESFVTERIWIIGEKSPVPVKELGLGKPVAQWLRYLTCTRKVVVLIPGVAMIRSTQLLLQGACILLSLINCKSLWIKASAK